MISSRNIAKAVVSLISNSPENTEKITKNLFDFVDKYHLEAQLFSIKKALETENMRITESKMLLIESPQELSDIDKKNIENYLSVPKGTQVKILKKPELLGGFRAYFQDKRVDGSIQNTLEKLRNNLVKLN